MTRKGMRSISSSCLRRGEPEARTIGSTRKKIARRNFERGRDRAARAAGCRRRSTGNRYLPGRPARQPGRVSVGVPVNVTARPGYDNQPFFLPNGRAFLYTSIREDSQADIYRYDIDTK